LGFFVLEELVVEQLKKQLEEALKKKV